MNKIEKSIKNVSKYLHLLACPKCHTGFLIRGNSLRCEKGHCFDIASKGYVNFLDSIPKSVKQYDQKLYVARRAVFEKGMFNPLIERLAAIAEGRKTLLDAGCGEGFLLSQIGKQITGSKIIGLDISKQGIMSAEKLSAMWIVGDLARMPFSDNSFDVVFNILSPARYDEFKRVLKGGGLLLKVVPNLNYLKEIRHFYGFSAEPSSIHEGSISVFSNYFAEYESENISYRYLCDSETIKNVLDMTPMLENIDDAKKNKFLESGIREITVDLNILFTVIRK